MCVDGKQNEPFDWLKPCILVVFTGIAITIWDGAGAEGFGKMLVSSGRLSDQDLWGGRHPEGAPEEVPPGGRL